MGTRVYIGRLSSYARERDIERFFKGYGRLKDIMLKNGYGFIVCFFLHITIFVHLLNIGRSQNYSSIVSSLL